MYGRGEQRGPIAGSLAMTVLILAGCATSASAPPQTSSGSAGSGVVTATPTRAPVPTPSPAYPGIQILPANGEIIRLSPPSTEVGYLGATTDAIWAATSVGLREIDPISMTATPAAGDTTGRFGLVANADEVWVTNFIHDSVERRDVDSGEVELEVDVPDSANAMALFGEEIWVAQHHGGSVTVLERASGKVIAVIAAGNPGSSGPQGVAVNANGGWVGVPNAGAVFRIDPETHQVVAKVETSTSPCGGIAIQADAVWVSSCFDDRKAIRIDPATNSVVAEIDIGGENGGAVIVDGYPWFPVANRLVRVDPATNAVDKVVQLDEVRFKGFGSVVAFDAVWIGGVGGEGAIGGVARIPLSVLAASE
jgi:hypothetical protein